MDTIDLKKLYLPGGSKVDLLAQKSSEKPLRHKPGEKFIKGPIPWNWMVRAAQLPGKAFQVGMVLQFLEGVTGRRTVALSSKVLRELGVNRYAEYRGLKALEKAGLVSVSWHIGRNPMVTILDPEEAMTDLQEESQDHGEDSAPTKSNHAEGLG